LQRLRDGSQSGFSQYGQAGCNGKRATPDVSLDADPASGVAVYDTTLYNGQTGWFTVGGTSAATPMWAGRAADLGAGISAATVYGSAIPFRDITSGNNGAPALTGYDLASGRGSWADAASPPPPGPPAAPTALSASAGPGKVTLGWSAPAGGATTYNVYRSTSSGTEALLAGGVTTAAYTDTAVSVGTKYFYVVAGVNSAGTGPASNEASATPSGSPPVAGFTKSCSGAACTFRSTSTDAGGTIVTYAWSGGNGLTGSSATASHTYNATGSFTVGLTVTDNLGLSGSASGSVKCTSNLFSRRVTCR
jgi:titin